jgi:GH25 family lysozyme M1 (1,4-beta-N-acetylmuramidase)
VYIKATEATRYANPWFTSDRAGARAAGIPRGAYAFARPSTTPGSAAAQARSFVARAGTRSGVGDLPPMLDLEVSGGLHPGQLTAWASTWLRAVRSLTGRTPVLYTVRHFWITAMADSTAFHRYPLFIADYGARAPSVPGGWPRWTFWQTGSSGRVGGIIGDVDTDRFNGSPAQLARLANVRGAVAPATAAHPPGPAPAGRHGG